MLASCDNVNSDNNIGFIQNDVVQSHTSAQTEKNTKRCSDTKIIVAEETPMPGLSAPSEPPMPGIPPPPLVRIGGIPPPPPPMGGPAPPSGRRNY